LPISPRGLRRLLARWGWLRHHLHPPAWAFLDVRVVRPSVLAVVPVGLLRRRGPLLDVLRGRRPDHHGRRGIVGVGRAPPAWPPPPRPPPPPNATPNEDPRAPIPPSASTVRTTAPPRAASVPPSASTVRTTTTPRAAPAPPSASCRPGASAPATGTTRRNLGGDGGANQKQPYQHKRPHDLLHGQSPSAEPERWLGLHYSLRPRRWRQPPHASSPLSELDQGTPSRAVNLGPSVLIHDYTLFGPGGVQVFRSHADRGPVEPRAPVPRRSPTP
jgi:hypothetical protein